MNRPYQTDDRQNKAKLNDNDSQTDSREARGRSRRSVLKQGAIVSGGALLGGRILSRSATASRGNLVSKVASHGHYAWFPLGPGSWGRSQNPVATKQEVEGQEEDARWQVQPAKGGGIRCRVENLPTTFRNAGFDVHLGALGSIEEVTIQSKTLETNWTWGSAVLVAALYFDVNDDGEFFAWSDGRGNTDHWDGFGGDTERGLARLAMGSFTIKDSTVLPVFADPSDPPTLGELKAGTAIDGVDGTTDTALYVGAASAGGDPAGMEDLIVESVTVTRG